MAENISGMAVSKPVVEVAIARRSGEAERRRLVRIKRAIRRKTSGGIVDLAVEVQGESLVLRGRWREFLLQAICARSLHEPSWRANGRERNSSGCAAAVKRFKTRCTTPLRPLSFRPSMACSASGSGCGTAFANDHRRACFKKPVKAMSMHICNPGKPSKKSAAQHVKLKEPKRRAKQHAEKSAARRPRFVFIAGTQARVVNHLRQVLLVRPTRVVQHPAVEFSLSSGRRQSCS